jgi:hypothetical protein
MSFTAGVGSSGTEPSFTRAPSGAPCVFHTASVSVSPMFPVESGRRLAVLFLDPTESPAVGVGSIVTASSRQRRPSSSNRRRAVSRFGFPLGPPSDVVGVGNEEDALASMRGTDVGST